MLQKRIKSGGSVTCVFRETISSDGYVEFRPVQKTDWFIGFTKSGEARSVHKCKPGSRSVQFVKRNLAEEAEEKEPEIGPEWDQIIDLFFQNLNGEDKQLDDNLQRNGNS